VELTILLTAASQATGEGSEEARTGLTLNPSGMLALGLEPEAPQFSVSACPFPAHMRSSSDACPAA